MFRSLSRFASFAVLLAGASTPLFSQEPVPEDVAPRLTELEGLPVVTDDLRRALMDGDVAEARRLCDEYAVADRERSAFWRLLAARALAHDDPAAALAEVRALRAAGGGDSRWRAKLVGFEAELLAAAGDSQALTELLRDAVARVLDEVRVSGLAGEVLERARSARERAAGRPPDAARPDLDRAERLLRGLLALELPSVMRDEALHELGLVLEARASWGDAAAVWKQWLAAFDVADDEATRYRPAPLRAFLVRWRLGRALERAQDHRAARVEFARLADESAAVLADERPWPGGALDEGTRRVLADLAAAGRYREGVAALRSGDAGAAVSALKRLREAWPEHPLAALAAFASGEALAAAGRPDEAVATWRAAIERPAPDFATIAADVLDAEELAQRMERMRMRAWFRLGQVLLDLSRFDEAERAFATYAVNHPDGPDWAAAQEGVVECEYRAASALVGERRYDEARAAWRRFLERHPLDARAADVLFTIGELFVLEADDLEADDPRRPALLEDAVAQWRAVARRYPGTERASEALFRVGVLLEEELGRLDEAVAAYRACDFGPWRGEAHRRLAGLVEESLHVAADRVFRGDETARVRVRLRNVDELEVVVRPLDLEAFFRDHHSAEGVDELDLDLIAGGTRFTHAVDGYAPYLPIATDVELPVTGPGAWVVTVTGGDLRASVLVMKSDLDLLVKGTSRDLVVWTQDRAADSPAPGVELLIAMEEAGEDGETLVVRRRTGDDGLLVASWDDLGAARRPQWCSVLALGAAGPAAVGSLLTDLTPGGAPTPRAHVTFDRPAYRAGEEVAFRAVVRGVGDDGGYAFTPGEAWRLEWSDPAGRVVAREDAALSARGTLAGRFRLPADARIGRWGLALVGPDERRHQVRFMVAAFVLPKAELTLTLDPPVAFPGERVVATAVATRWYGAPLTDEPLRFVLPDGTQRTVATDAEGRARVEWTAAERGTVRVELPRLGLHASAAALVPERAFDLELSLPSPPRLAGQPFEARVAATDPLGRPVPDVEVTMVVSRTVLHPEIRTAAASVPATWSLEEYRRFTGVTDDAGVVAFQAALPEGGDWVLEVFAEDRFGHPVGASRDLSVAAPDEEHLVFLAPPPAHVGGSVRLTLVAREDAGWTLLTLLADGVLEARVERLRAGENDVVWDLGAEAWPNVAVEADHAGDGHVDSAAVEFEVRQELTVELGLPDGEVAPGGPVEVPVVVRDSLGRPVSAELAVSVVDQALLAVRPDLTVPLRDAFLSGVWRLNLTDTESSSTFGDAMQGSPVPEAILEEEAESAARLEWERDREEALALAAPATPAAPSTPTAPAAGFGLEPLEELGFDSAEDLAALGYAMGGGGGGKHAGRRGGRYQGPGDSVPPLREEALDDTRAFWTASLVTDAEGRGVLRFDAPPKVGRWRVLARAVAGRSAFGESEGELRTGLPVFAELRVPPVLTEGDQPRFGAVLVKPEDLAGPVAFELRVGQGDRAWTFVANGEAEAGRRRLAVWFDPPPDFVLPEAGTLSLDLAVRLTPAGVEPFTAAVTREVPVRPWGTRVAVSSGGRLDGDRTVELVLPAGHDWRELALELWVGHGVGDLVVATALGEGPGQGARTVLPGADLVPGKAALLLGVAAVVRARQAEGLAEGSVHEALLRRGAELVADLLAAQRDDGGWSWSGRTDRPGGPTPTAWALWALAEARATAWPVADPAVTGAVGWLEPRFRALPQQDRRTAALALLALTRAGRGDFAVANRLHRLRSGLDVAALAMTTLALDGLGRGPMAADCAAELAARFVLGEGWPADGPTLLDSTARDALAVMALAAGGDPAGIVEDARAVLLAEQPWTCDLARGLAVAALARSEPTVHGDEELVVEADLGDGVVERVALRGGAGARLVAFPAAGLQGGRAALHLRVRGRGAVAYTAVLRGFTRDLVPLRDPALAVLSAHWEAPQPVLDGRALPVGFGILGDERERWTNEVHHLEFGAEAVGVVRWRRLSRERDPVPADVQLLVPLPAGVRLAPNGVSGSVAAWEVRDGVLVCVLPEGAALGEIRFRVAGAEPGTYRTLPATLRSASAPERAATGEPGELVVLPPGAASDDAYRPTPEERFARAAAARRRGDLDTARAEALALLDEFESELRPEPLREVAGILLTAALAQERPAEIVRAFELLQEGDPGRLLPPEDVARVADAYRALGEDAFAADLLRGVLASLFARDQRVPDLLEGAGDVPAAVELRLRLWREYPDAPMVDAALLVVGEDLLARAPDAHRDEAMRRAGLDRAALTVAAARVFRVFLALHPDDPAAPDAGLDLVQVFLDLEEYRRAADLAAEMAGRFADREHRENFLYTEAVAAWYAGDEERAEARLAQLVEEGGDRPAAPGQASNRDLALYILGQIHHARRDFAGAAEYYERVAGLFEDAAESLRIFRSRLLELDEVVEVRPGEEAVLPMRWNRIDEVEVTAWPVDLMTLYLRDRDLADVTDVDLAGIPPALTKTVSLSADPTRLTQEGELRLGELEPGAWLVIARGGDRRASGFVLVSDLGMEVQEYDELGRVRVQVYDREDGRFLRGVEVRVVGSEGERVFRAETDPRGVAVVDGVRGRATVVARWQDRHYAFHRGAVELYDLREQQERDKRQLLEQGGARPSLQAEDYFSNVIQSNALRQEARRAQLRQQLQTEAKGLRIGDR